MGQVLSTNNDDNALTRSYTMINGATPDGAGNSKKRKRKYVKKAKHSWTVAEARRQLLLSFLFHVELQNMQVLGVALPEALGVKELTICEEEKLLNSLATKLNCGDLTKAFVRDCYTEWKDGRESLFTHFKDDCSNYKHYWEAAMKERAEFFSAAMQLFLTKNYTELNKLFEKKEKQVLVGLKNVLEAMIYTSELLDLMFLYRMLKYYAVQSSNEEFKKYLEKIPRKVNCKIDEALQLMLLRVIYRESDRDVCKNIKNILSAFTCIANTSRIVIALCEEVRENNINMTSVYILECAQNRLFDSWKTKTKHHQEIIVSDTRSMLSFYDKLFIAGPGDHRLLLEFFLNPCVETYDELQEFCIEDVEDDDLWEVYETLMCEQLTVLFEAGIDVIFRQKEKRLQDEQYQSKRVEKIFMLAHKMDTVNIVDRFQLIETILSHIETTFLPKEIEQLCYSYLHREPKSRKEIELMHRVIRLLNKTGLKCRGKVMSILDTQEVEVEKSEAPKTRIQCLEKEIRDMKAYRREEFLCPIAHDVMFDPVTVVPCGHAFERYNIKKYISLDPHFVTCPTCRAYIGFENVLNECQLLRSMVLPYLRVEQQRLKKILEIVKEEHDPSS